jgi:molybdate/tungstate transport system permease protein
MGRPRAVGRRPWFDLLFTLLGSLVLLLVLAPLLGLLLATSPGELSEAAADREVTSSIRLTLLAALAATAACTLTGIPLAYLLARRDFRGKAAINAIIDLPIIIPHSAAGIALLTVVGRNSLLGGLAERLGTGFVGTSLGIAVAMAFVSLPFLVNAAREGFAMVPERLERAARTLGGSPGYVFRTVSLPLAWRSVLSGMIMMWARGISEFGAVVIIAYHPMTTPVLVFQRFNDFGLAYSRSAAVLLVLLCVAIFVLLRWLARRPHGPGAGDA